MSNLTLEQRNRLAVAEFADPQRRLFPILDQDDVDLCVRLADNSPDPACVRENLAKICSAKGLKLTEGFSSGGGKEDPDKVSIAFSLSDDGLISGGFVTRDAPCIFKAGEYPDKKFSLSPEEAIAAVAEFSAPVQIGLEHVPTVLDGKLGSVTEVKSDGANISGKASIPVWLDSILGKDERKLSALFSRATKKLIGVDIVRSPRVTDARLTAAFSAAFAGPPEQAGPSSGADLSGLTSGMQNPGGNGAKHGGELFKEICKMIDSALANADESIFSKDYIKKLNKIKELCGGGAGRDDGGYVKENPQGPPNVGMSAELEEERARSASLARKLLQQEAASFADSEILASRAVPAEREALVSMYFQAGMDDERDSTTVRRDLLKKRQAERPAFSFSRELLPGDPQKQDAGSETERLLSKTPLGRAILEQKMSKNGANSN